MSWNVKVQEILKGPSNETNTYSKIKYYMLLIKKGKYQYLTKNQERLVGLSKRETQNILG
jgi:hypothetical protein